MTPLISRWYWHHADFNWKIICHIYIYILHWSQVDTDMIVVFMHASQLHSHYWPKVDAGMIVVSCVCNPFTFKKHIDLKFDAGVFVVFLHVSQLHLNYWPQVDADMIVVSMHVSHLIYILILSCHWYDSGFLVCNPFTFKKHTDLNLLVFLWCSCMLAIYFYIIDLKLMLVW